MCIRLSIACLVSSLLLCASPLAAQPASPDSTTQDPKAEARVHFERGLVLFKREAWDPALAEFLRSRASYATRGNTQNAALCLSKLERYDEALDMFEALLAEFGSSLPDRAQVENEVKTLRGMVGSIEIRLGADGATVIVDGRTRGTTPLKNPIRVSTGTHLVRIFKEGVAPYEVRVEVAGGDNEIVIPELTLLTRAGRLKVVERSGKKAEVLVDGVVVGTTPWQGSLEPGSHSVLLRGEGQLGTQPVRAPVRVDHATVLTLGLESLECELRLDPEPLSATLAVDGVEVGRGTWQGRLRCGNHRVEARAEGFLTLARSVTLSANAARTERIQLERDPESSEWKRKNPPRIFLGLRAYGLVSPTLGGDVWDSCSAGCKHSLPFGGLGELEGGYQFASGISLSTHVGALWLRSNVTGRSLTPREVPNGTAFAGKTDDRLTLYGLTLGASAGLQRGSEGFAWMARFSAGALFGSMEDRRSGTIDMGARGVHDFGPRNERLSARYLYVSPEFALGPRFGRFELSFALRPMLFIALTQPAWDRASERTNTVTAPSEPAVPLFRFPEESTTGRSFFLLATGVSARYNFL